VLVPIQGGTGIGTAAVGNLGQCLKVSDNSPFTYELGACGAGGLNDWKVNGSYLTPSTTIDVLLPANATSTGKFAASGGNSDQWNTAFGWGNHASAGYYAAASFNTDWAGQANATTTTDSDSTWTLHNSYPAACSAGDFVTALGDTLTCATPPSGGGGGSGLWATTTAESFIYNNPVGYQVLIGSNATTTNLNLDLEVIGDSLLGGNNTSTGAFVIGNDSAGDSNIKLRDTWIFGLDDSDDDNLVFSSGATLGSSIIAKFTTGGLFASSTLFTRTTTTNLAILGANAANCDLKSTTAGVVYCGTDADSGAGTGSNWNYFDATTIKPTSTVGMFINASSTFNSTLRVNGLLSGDGVTTAQQNFWNGTTTWTAYDTNWARNANATTTQTNFLQSWNNLHNATTTYPGAQTQFNNYLNATTTLDLDALGINVATTTKLCFAGSGNCQTDVVAAGTDVTFFFHNQASDIATYERLRTYPNNGTEIAETGVSTSGSYGLIDPYVSTTTDYVILDFPAGAWHFSSYAKVNLNVGDSRIVHQVFKRNAAGTETQLFSATSTELTTDLNLLLYDGIVDTASTFLATDRLVIKNYCWSDSGIEKTCTFYYDGKEHYSHVQSPINIAALGYTRANINETITGSWLFTSATNTINNLVVSAFTVNGTLALPANSVTNAMVSDTLTASDLVAGGSVVADAEVDDSITINTALQGIFSGQLRVATLNATTTKTDNLTVNTTFSLPANAVTDAMVSDTLTCSDLQAAGQVVDISSETNLTAGDHITLTGDDLDVDDDYLLNNGDTGTGIYIFSGDLRVTGVLHATSTDFDKLVVNGNATSSHLALTELCIAGDCKTAWPEGGAVTWEDVTGKPATSTILNLLDTQNRVAMFNSTTTNIGTLIVFTALSLPANAVTDAMVSDTLTASALAANGANCTNQFPLGVDTAGAAESCTTITSAYMGMAGAFSWTGLNTWTDARAAMLNATTTKTDNLTVNTTLSLPANAVTDAMVSDTLTCSDLQAASAVVADSEVVDALTISTSAEGIFTGNIRTNAINATTTKTDTLTVYGNSTMAAVTTTNLAVSGLLNCDTIDTDGSGSFKCGTDASTAGSAGSNWDYFDATTIKPTTTVGFFISASSTINSTLRVTGSLTAPGGITGALTGNASTASALSADPSDCAAGTAATAIGTNGNLTCSITPLISGGTLTSANVCQYDGTGIDCDLVKDNTGDCASGAVCLGDHTHSLYAPIANPTFTGLQIAPDLRAAMLNSTTTKVGTLTVFTGSTLSGLSTIADGRLAVINSTTTKSDNLTVNTSLTSAASTLNGLTIAPDLRAAMINSTTTKVDNLFVTKATSSLSLIIPTAAASDVDAAGEIAIDTTSDQLQFYGGAKRVIPYWGEKCFTMASTTWGSVKTNIPLWHPRKAVTITDVYCETEAGTSVAVVLGDGTNSLESITCDDDGAADDGSIANGTLTADEKFEVDLGTVTGAVDYLNVCISYDITSD
jgi:hypothetical protein